MVDIWLGRTKNFNYNEKEIMLAYASLSLYDLFIWRFQFAL